MKTAMATTSLAAYRSLDLGRCAQKLLSVMQHGNAYTDRQLAALCNEECGWVPQRRKELIAAGLVEYAGQVKSTHSPGYVMAHRLTAKQLELLT